MSNQKTMTITQKKAALEADARVAKAERERELLAFERTTLNTFLERVENGEFETEDGAHTAGLLTLKDASQSTLDAFDAQFVDSWTVCVAKAETRAEVAKKDKAWAEARLHLLNNLGSDFIRSWSFEDGQLPTEALGLHQLAAAWHRDGYIGKVNAYVNITPEGGATYKLVVSNPQRVKGQRNPQPKTEKKKG